MLSLKYRYSMEMKWWLLPPSLPWGWCVAGGAPERGTLSCLYPGRASWFWKYIMLWKYMPPSLFVVCYGICHHPPIAQHQGFLPFSATHCFSQHLLVSLNELSELFNQNKHFCLHTTLRPGTHTCPCKKCQIHRKKRVALLLACGLGTWKAVLKTFCCLWFSVRRCKMTQIWKLHNFWELCQRG